MPGATVRPVRASLFVTCVVDLLDPDVGVATVRVLRAAGCQVSVPEGQTCCGQPAWNSGFADEAAAVARTTLAALERDAGDVVVVPAGSCATMIRVFWPELFELVGDHDAAERARALGERTRELSEFLAERAEHLPALGLAEPERVAYHHSCHMLRELRIEEQPERLLAAVEGVELVPWEASSRCCGFGGLFAVKLPEASEAMADHKLDQVRECGATVLCGSDASCLLHLRTRAEHEGRPVRTAHLAQVVAAALPEPA
jgi:L-lactate dehydrogenase complex protein LldE